MNQAVIAWSFRVKGYKEVRGTREGATSLVIMIITIIIILTWHEAVSAVTPDVAAEVEPGLHPLHAEVEAEGDGVVLVIDTQHIRYLETFYKERDKMLSADVAFLQISIQLNEVKILISGNESRT